MQKVSVKEGISFIPAVQQGNGAAIVEINGQAQKVRRKVFYIAGLATEIAASGDLIEQKTNKEVGVTNFDGGNKLNAGRNLMVVGIRVRFDTTADVTVKTAGWKSEAPANFLNGELRIEQDGSGNLLEMPIGAICKYNASIATEDEFQAVVPFLIRSNTTFNIKALLASAAATNQAYRVELDCLEFGDATMS